MKGYRSYQRLILDLNDADIVDTRIGPSHELLNQQFTFRAGAMVYRPGFSKALAWTELLQLLGGQFERGALKLAAPKANLEYFTEQMAYGPRIAPQLGHVLSILESEPDSRRAIIQVADQGEDEPTCTLSIHFLIRDGELRTFVYMRSWDAWLGLPYDIVMFGGLAQAMAEYLLVKAGNVTVTASSLHLYLQHVGLSSAYECDNFGHFLLRPDTNRMAFPDGYCAWLMASARQDLERCPWKGSTPSLINYTAGPVYA